MTIQIEIEPHPVPIGSRSEFMSKLVRTLIALRPGRTCHVCDMAYNTVPYQAAKLARCKIKVRRTDKGYRIWKIK